jgi:hypothetical protein
MIRPEVVLARSHHFNPPHIFGAIALLDKFVYGEEQLWRNKNDRLLSLLCDRIG